MSVTFLNLAQTAPAAAQPDYLAGAVLHSLTRPLGGRPWGPVRAVVYSILTFGIAPLIFWPRRLRDLVIVEQQQLWHLAQWFQQRSRRPEADELCRMADRIRFRWELWLLSLACVGAVVLAFLWQRQWLIDRHDLLGATWFFGRGRYAATGAGHDVLAGLFAAWTGGLALAYALHWAHVQWHAASVARFVQQFNRLAAFEGVAAVPERPLGLGVRVTWLLAGAVLLLLGALWGIPLALAAAVQMRYAERISPGYRDELARRVRGVLTQRPSAAPVPLPVRLRALCHVEKCRAELAEAARFCPRCGTPRRADDAQVTGRS